MSVCPVKKLECLTLQADLTVLHSCYFVALCLSLLICVSSDVRQEYIAKILFFFAFTPIYARKISDFP